MTTRRSDIECHVITDFPYMLCLMQNTTSREEIAATVRAEMARRRVEVREIAAVIGKSQASASERVNGKTHFRVSELQAVAALLDVPVAHLIEPNEHALTPVTEASA